MSPWAEDHGSRVFKIYRNATAAQGPEQVKALKNFVFKVRIFNWIDD